MEVTRFENDFFDLKEFSQRLEKFITIEEKYVDGGLVIALNASYGSGKSTFLNMWKNDIEADEENDARPFVIKINAWESDYYGDPLFGLISALVHSENEGEIAAKERVIEAAKDIGWFMTGLGGQVASAVTGVNPIAAGEFAERKKSERDDRQVKFDSFTLYEDRKKAMSELQDALRDFVVESGRLVLFMVDELDRCRPDYAISYLETIKHIFDIPRAVFMLSADRHQLENTAKMAFGADLNFDEYYRKFIHREVQLPQLSEASYVKIVNQYIKYYLESEGERNCILSLDSNSRDNIAEVVKGLRLTPRQTQEVFRILGHTFETSEDKKGRLLWALGVGTILMAALKVGSPVKYKEFGLKAISPEQAYEFINKLVGDNYTDWWFDIVFTGGGVRMSEGETAEDVYRKVGLLKEDQALNEIRNFSQLRSGWGNDTRSRIPEIYSKIETVMSWK